MMIFLSLFLFCFSFSFISQALQQPCPEGGRPDHAGMSPFGQSGLYCLHGFQPKAGNFQSQEELRKNVQTADPLAPA